MERKRLNRLSCFLVLVLSLHFADPSSLIAKDHAKEVLDYFKTQYPEMKSSSIYARETTLNLIKKSRVYAVSCADIIPFRTWYIVVDPSGIPHALSYKKISPFNRFIKNESLDLKTDYDYQNFIRLFLALTANNEMLLRIIPERSRIREEYQKLDFSTRIKASSGKAILVFFSQDVTGSLKRWQMTVKSTGEITHFDKKDISN